MGLFKLGKMTFGSLFKKPETVLYPLQTKPVPAGLKGHIAIEVETCILCGLCERSCPTDCITVDKNERVWRINRYSCIQCGYCTTVCPKKCLAMEPGYAPAATAVEFDMFEVPQAAPAPKAVESAKAADEKPAPEGKETGDASRPQAEEKQQKPVDAVLEAKIAIMDAEKAEKVRTALGAR